MQEREILLQRKETLESTPVEGMTIGQVRATVQELCDIELQLQTINRKSIRNSQTVSNTPIYVPHVETHQEPIRKPKRKLSELNVGRSVMTVLAASLCLLALGAFIASFWLLLPSAIKFVLLFVIGAALEALGVWRHTNKTLKSFWLGVAGLGASTIFVILMAGCVLWQLYGIGLLGLLVFAWVAAHVFLGDKYKAGTFYVIAHIGGALSMLLGNLLLEVSGIGSIALTVLSAAIVTLGMMQFIRTKSNLLLALNLAFCLLSGFILVAFEGDQSNIITQTYLIALPTLCLYNTRYIKWEIHGEDWLLRTAVTFFCGSFLLYCVDHAIMIPVAVTIACLSVFTFCFVYSQRGYLLGISVVLFAVLSGLQSNQLYTAFSFTPSQVYQYSMLLPATAVLLFCLLCRYFKDSLDRMALELLFVLTVKECILHSGDVQLFECVASVCLLLCSLALWYCLSSKYSLYTNEVWEKFVASVIPGALLIILSSRDMLPRSLPFAVITIGMQVYWLFILSRLDSAEYALHRAWAFVRFAFYFALLVCCLSPSLGDKFIITVSLILTLGFSVYRAIQSDARILSVQACLIANWHLMVIASLWGLTQYAVVISIVGLGVSCVFIVEGFLIDRKGARQAGLVCAVGYALKIGLVDINLRGGLSAAGGLLVAGVMCFGISYAYHRLGLQYNTKEQDESVESEEND